MKIGNNDIIETWLGICNDDAEIKLTTMDISEYNAAMMTVINDQIFDPVIMLVNYPDLCYIDTMKYSVNIIQIKKQGKEDEILQG